MLKILGQSSNIPRKLALLATTLVLSLLALAISIFGGEAHAASPLTPIPTPPPKPGSYGLVAVKKQPAPTAAPSITTPASGSSFTKSPITVSGVCSKGLLVEIFDNDVFVGSVVCQNGSFSLKVGLFVGKNVLKAIQYDSLDQASPESNHVSVNYKNTNYTGINPTTVGKLITLTSNYGRRAADPGDTLTWPLQLSGGTGPYAFSIDWGDNTKASLKSVALAGNVDINHVYKQSGIYNVTIRVTDKNGESAFLQVVAVANGKASPIASTTNQSSGEPKVIYKVLWIPVLIMLILLFPAYWLGRRSEVVSIHKRLEKDLNEYKEV